MPKLMTRTNSVSIARSVVERLRAEEEPLAVGVRRA